MKEARTLLTLEAHPEGLFERRTHRLEGGRVARRLDPRESVACIGREQPCQVLWLGQRGTVRQCTAQVLAQSRADLTGEGARRLQPAFEHRLAAGKPEGFERCLVTLRVLADQHEFAQVGHQYQTIAAPVASDLLAHRPRLHVIVRGFHLHHAALRNLTLARTAPLHLLRPIEAEVGMAHTLVGKLAYTEHLRPERRADRVEQIRERPVARPLPCRTAGGTYPPEIGEVGLDRCAQLRVRSRHRLCRHPALRGVQVPRPRPWQASPPKAIGSVHYVVDIEARRTTPTASPGALRVPPPTPHGLTYGCTPALRRGRRRYGDIAGGAGNRSIATRERDVDRSEFFAASEAFFCGTGWEIAPINAVDGAPVGAGRPGEITRKLQKAYFDLVNGVSGDRPEWLSEA